MEQGDQCLQIIVQQQLVFAGLVEEKLHSEKNECIYQLTPEIHLFCPYRWEPPEVSTRSNMVRPEAALAIKIFIKASIQKSFSFDATWSKLKNVSQS